MFFFFFFFTLTVHKWMCFALKERNWKKTIVCLGMCLVTLMSSEATVEAFVEVQPVRCGKKKSIYGIDFCLNVILGFCLLLHCCPLCFTIFSKIGYLSVCFIFLHFPCFLQEEDLLGTFNKQVEEDRKVVISRSNLNELHKVWS